MEKKPSWKGYMLYGFNYITFWERPICGEGKKVNGFQVLEGKKA